MAKVQSDPDQLVRVLAYAASAIVVAMVAWAMLDGILSDRDHEKRITGLENRQETILTEINRRLGIIEQELRDGR